MCTCPQQRGGFAEADWRRVPSGDQHDQGPQRREVRPGGRRQEDPHPLGHQAEDGVRLQRGLRRHGQQELRAWPPPQAEAGPRSARRPPGTGIHSLIRHPKLGS